MDHDWQVRMSDLNETFQAILREHDDDGIGKSARLYDRIDRAFNLFSCGEDFAAGEMSKSLYKAKDELIKDNEEEFRGALEDLYGWQGAAAGQFRDYLNQLDDGVTLMVDRIDTLLLILRSHEVLVSGMREDVLDLVRKTLDGIAAAETDGWEVGVTVAGAVAGVVAGVAGVTGPPGVMIGMIAAEMVAGAAGVVVEANGAEDEFGVMVNFVDSAEGLLHLIDIERLRIEKGFRALAESITEARLREVRPDRPVIVTASDFQPASFGMEEDVQAGHPVPTNTTDLLPEPKKRADGPFDRTTTPDGEEHDRYAEQGPA